MQVIHGTFAHTPSFGKLEILQDTYIGIENGVIVFIEKNKDAFLSHNLSKNCIFEYYEADDSKIFVPGFIDLHVHSAQYAYTGTGTNVKLMDWLNLYAYPSEKKLKNNPKYAHSLYDKLVRRLLSNGITTTQFFGTIDIDSNLILAKTIQKYGVRGYIGKVCQDQYSPKDYCESTAKSIANTEMFIHKILSLKSDLISPVITPRFIPNCSEQLLDGLGKLVRKYPTVHIQSHITESLDEIAFVHHLFGDKADSAIFDKHGLLSDKCVMAHAVHCSDSDFKLLSSKGVSIAHCPLSNAFFAHGSLDVYELVNRFKIKVGLGTDIAGGYSYSMLDCMRQAVVTNRMRHKNNCDKFINYKHALYLATYGGAKCLGLHNEVGLFKVGMAFEAVLLDTENIDIFAQDNIENVVEKLLNLSDDRNIKAVWVKGKRIHIRVSKL